jgi:hypothetical protein
MGLSNAWLRIRDGLSNGRRLGAATLDAARDEYAAQIFADSRHDPAVAAVVDGYAQDFAARLALTGARLPEARHRILTAWANELIADCGGPQDVARSPYKHPWPQLRLAGLCECAIREGLLRRARRTAAVRILATIA